MINKPQPFQSLGEALEGISRALGEWASRLIFGTKELPFSEERWRKDSEELRQARERLEAAVKRAYW